MKLVCLGAGSLGMLLAGKLSLAMSASRLLLVAHGEDQASRLNSDGLRLICAYDGSNAVETCAVPTVSYARAFGGGRAGERIAEADWLLLAVKQQHLTDSLLKQLAAALGSKTKLVCFQNGIGHADKLAAHVPADRIYVAVTTEGALKSGENTVQHTGRGQTWIGRAFAQREPDAANAGEDEGGASGALEDDGGALDELARIMRTAGFDIVLSNRINTFLWNKLLINSVINPLTAIHQIRNGQLLESPFLLGIMRRLYEEGYAVARASGVAIDGGLWEQLLRVCERTAGNRSSMLQDVLNGRRTEIDWINGHLIRLADRFGMAAPANRAVFNRIKSLETAKNRECAIS